MSASRRRYLVAYDVRDDRRLRQVHTTIKGFGWAMQYSVFICDLEPAQRFALLGAVGAIIDHRADSIAMIDLGDPAERGKQCFQFLGVPVALPQSGPLII